MAAKTKPLDEPLSFADAERFERCAERIRDVVRPLSHRARLLLLNNALRRELDAMSPNGRRPARLN